MYTSCFSIFLGKMLKHLHQRPLVFEIVLTHRYKYVIIEFVNNVWLSAITRHQGTSISLVFLLPMLSPACTFDDHPSYQNKVLGLFLCNHMVGFFIYVSLQTYFVQYFPWEIGLVIQQYNSNIYDWIISFVDLISCYIMP